MRVGSSRTQLPASVEAFVNDPAASKDACALEARRGAEAAQRLFDTADARHDWPLESPSVTSHLLLACGRHCPSPTNEDGLVDEWFLGMLDEDDTLHRGELLALAAELRLRPEKPIMWRSRDVASIGELLEQTAREFSVPPARAWDSREAIKGPVYGWELQALCTYLGPHGQLDAERRVSEAVAAASSAGPNTKTEAGTHDLEGLALCLAEHHQNHESATPADQRRYDTVDALLRNRLALDLREMRRDGQVYAEDDSFDACDQNDPECVRWAYLLRQAHFVEWTALYDTSCTPAYLEALQRFTVLAQGSLEGVSEARQWPLAMLLLASTHAMHAGRRLALRYGPSSAIESTGGGP